jgi:hypothetical protein
MFFPILVCPCSVGIADGAEVIGWCLVLPVCLRG